MNNIPVDLAWLAFHVKDWPAGADDRDSIRRDGKDKWSFTMRHYCPIPCWTYEELYEAKKALGVTEAPTQPKGHKP